MEFKDLLKSRRLEIGATLEEIGNATGVTKATVQRWESGEIKDIRRDKIVRLAEALRVTPAYLMGWEEDAEPVLNARDQRDIAKTMEELRERLMNEDGLMFDGDPLSPEALESILNAMQLGLQAAKQQNKEKYTPKKYKKPQE